MPTIYPSLIGANQLRLQEEIERLDPHSEGYHLDIMDNHFVPNLTWGTPIVNAIARVTRRTLSAHLMVDNPQEWIDILQLPPGSIFTFHIEAIGQNVNFIHQIKEKEWLVGVALSPGTDVEVIFPLLNLVDRVLIMSVEPGFAGQPFIPSVLEKIDPLIGYRESQKLDFRIAMDGGITLDNIAMLAQKGVEDFVVASAIFKNSDPIKALKLLQQKLV